MSERRHIIIVGAGLGGSLLACFLAKRGYRVSVHERRSDPRARGFIGGRSINLALSTRGIDALGRVGLAERVLDEAVPMRGRMLHDQSGRLAYQPYSKNPDEAINSVSRGGLNLQLLHAAAEHGAELHFDHQCLDVDIETPSVSFRDAAGATVEASADAVVGADGAFSAIRLCLQRTDRFTYSQTYLEHGYKELTIPPTSSGEFAMEPNALHIWPRGSAMMIALPNPDRSFTCTLFWPYEGEISFGSIRGTDDVEPFFRRHFPDAVPLMPTLVEDYDRNPTSSLVTVRCSPWNRGRVVLIGDAAHAVVPFYGQGMNASFEDCVVLDGSLDRHGHDLEAAFDDFSRRHHRNGHAIADLALDNFIEMRDHTGSRLFRLRKRLEKVLHRLLPQWYTPLYNMVTFSSIPYAEARQRGRRQARAVKVAAACAALVILAAIVIGARVLVSAN